MHCSGYDTLLFCVAAEWSGGGQLEERVPTVGGPAQNGDEPWRRAALLPSPPCPTRARRHAHGAATSPQQAAKNCKLTQ